MMDDKDIMVVEEPQYDKFSEIPCLINPAVKCNVTYNCEHEDCMWKGRDN